MHYAITHIEKAGSYTWEFADTEGATDSTLCDITNVSKWHGLGDTPQRWIGSILGGRKITAKITGETLEGSMATCCPQWSILLSHSCKAWLQTTRDSEIALIHWGMWYPQLQKIPKYCLIASSEGFEYGTTVVWQNSISLSKESSALGSISYETRSIRQHLIAGHWTFFKVQGC